jgi:hypothetical protein
MIVSNFDKRLAARLAKNLYQVLVQSLVYIFSTSSITFPTMFMGAIHFVSLKTVLW